MNIGIVCYPTFGGSGVLATELGKALADKGHNIHFITYQQPVRLSSFHANIFYHEVRVPTYPLFDYPPYETALASTMVDVVLNNNVELLHVHYAIPHASAAYMAKQILAKHGKHVPVMTTLHGTDITLVGRDKTYSPVVTFSMEESDILTAVSQNLKEETYKNFTIKKEIEVIHNFVDVNRFHKKPVDAFKKLIAPNGEKIIVHASNFRKVKRVDDVVNTFLLLNQQIPSKLLLLGDGPERPYAESICRDCTAMDNIKFLGKQEQMEDILPIADLFLLTSEYESFGLAALEAMAAEVPVISTNAGGLPEININGYCGYMSNVGDIMDMCKNAVSILKDETTLKQFRANALAQARKFDISSIVPKYEELYIKMVTGMQNKQ
ncbi:MAG: N-acetyl-alpha-D-glucosaminyl L-malate synthase BshA [Ferruginibacter sp.]